MTARSELLGLLNALQNEVAMSTVDPEESLLGDHPKIISKLTACIAAIESMFPMIQACEEVLDGDITPKLFYRKWLGVAAHMGIDDGLTKDDIDGDVKGFLDKFSTDIDVEDDEDDE